ncbi:MAG: hypothetical protein SFT94_00300 [Pseudanabaenaceae cyanobacterium bins.68]|nr:hypothetical protein [Pseudanabaenaceae cyanobacterium bins.68]
MTQDEFQAQILSRLDKLDRNNERLNDKFDAYQKASDLVVRLSFTLIISATVALSISAITLIVKFLSD